MRDRTARESQGSGAGVPAAAGAGRYAQRSRDAFHAVRWGRFVGVGVEGIDAGESWFGGVACHLISDLGDHFPREAGMRLVNNASALIHGVYRWEKVEDVARWRDAVFSLHRTDEARVDGQPCGNLRRLLFHRP